MTPRLTTRVRNAWRALRDRPLLVEGNPWHNPTRGRIGLPWTHEAPTPAQEPLQAPQSLSGRWIPLDGSQHPIRGHERLLESLVAPGDRDRVTHLQETLNHLSGESHDVVALPPTRPNWGRPGE